MVQDKICKLASFNSRKTETCEEAFARIPYGMRPELEETMEKEGGRSME